MGRPVLAAALFVCLPAFAAFQPLPPEEPGQPPTGLEVRVVSYDGSTNGAITVEVRNPGTEARTFAAKGLFFVPAVDPDKAPQRLGAVGSIEVKGGRQERVKLAAGASVTARLDVYCIDSHRSSPTSSTPFRVATQRLPPQLVKAINSEAEAVTNTLGGVHAAPAKSAVQSTVWKNRDAKWIKVEGESQQEATK